MTLLLPYELEDAAGGRRPLEFYRDAGGEDKLAWPALLSLTADPHMRQLPAAGVRVNGDVLESRVRVLNGADAAAIVWRPHCRIVEVAAEYFRYRTPRMYYTDDFLCRLRAALRAYEREPAADPPALRLAAAWMTDKHLMLHERMRLLLREHPDGRRTAEAA